MKTVHLARGLTLPAAELATKVFGSFGIRGSGKSNLMAVVVEGLLTANVQVVILDPVGIWFSLRLQPDGKTASRFKIPVLGGRHGDIVLQPTAGAVVGHALALSNDACVLDISAMKKSERIRFAADFFESFYEAKKENPSPCLICAEEAQRIAPQIMFKGSGQERLLGAVEEYAEQARNYGGGLMLNTLRPQKVNKDITSLMDLVISFRLTGVHERKAVREWVQEKDAPGRDAIDTELPGLPDGHAFVWSPAAFDIKFGKYHFEKKTTYDAGATPLYARAKVKMRPLDLNVLEEQMKEVVSEAKANDPRVLRTRIAELEKEVQNRGIDRREVQKESRVQRSAAKPAPVLREADFKRIERLIEKCRMSGLTFNGAFSKLLDRNAQAQQAIVSELGNLDATLKKCSSEAATTRSAADAPSRSADRQPIPTRRAATYPPARSAAPFSASARSADPATLSKCARALLSVLAQRGVATDSQVSAFSGYRKTSSGFSNALSELRTQGLLDGSRDRLTITQAGIDLIGPTEPLPSGPKLLDYWARRLSKSEAAMLLSIHKFGTITREQLSAETGYSITSSGFSNAISGLRVLDLVHGPSGGDLTIAEVFRA